MKGAFCYEIGSEFKICRCRFTDSVKPAFLMVRPTWPEIVGKVLAAKRMCR